MPCVTIRSATCAATVLLGATLSFSEAHAVEGGGSNYLLGMRGPLAAFVPNSQ